MYSLFILNSQSICLPCARPGAEDRHKTTLLSQMSLLWDPHKEETSYIRLPGIFGNITVLGGGLSNNYHFHLTKNSQLKLREVQSFV